MDLMSKVARKATEQGWGDSILMQLLVDFIHEGGQGDALLAFLDKKIEETAIHNPEAN